MAYKRKTEDEFIIQGHYMGSWEDVTTETNRTDLRTNLRLYRQNEPGTSFRWYKKRVPINA